MRYDLVDMRCNLVLEYYRAFSYSTPASSCKPSYFEYNLECACLGVEYVCVDIG